MCTYVRLMVERLSPNDLRQIIHIYRMYQSTSVIFHGIVVVLIIVGTIPRNHV